MKQAENIINIIRKHKNKPDKLLEILQETSEYYHHVSDEMMKTIAEHLNISAAKVYGTATFYSFINTEKQGRHNIKMCKTISCEMLGYKSVLKAVINATGIKPGETSHDQKFSLKLTNCLGFCHKGPAMLINNDIYTELNPQKAIRIIEQLD